MTKMNGVPQGVVLHEAVGLRKAAVHLQAIVHPVVGIHQETVRQDQETVQGVPVHHGAVNHQEAIVLEAADQVIIQAEADQVLENVLIQDDPGSVPDSFPSVEELVNKFGWNEAKEQELAIPGAVNGCKLKE